MSDFIPALLITLITIFFPPAGVFIMGGCNKDLLLNVILTFLGLLPGHIHAFYLEYVYFDRRQKGRMGQLSSQPAPLVFSENIQTGGMRGYGTM